MRHGKVLDAIGAQCVRESDDVAGYIGLHCSFDFQAVLASELRSWAEQFMQFVSRTGFGVQVERHCGKPQPAFFDAADQLFRLFGRAVRQPSFDGVQRLIRSSETSPHRAGRRWRASVPIPNPGIPGGLPGRCVVDRCSQCRNANGGLGALTSGAAVPK